MAATTGSNWLRLLDLLMKQFGKSDSVFHLSDWCKMMSWPSVADGYRQHTEPVLTPPSIFFLFKHLMFSISLMPTAATRCLTVENI